MESQQDQIDRLQRELDTEKAAHKCTLEAHATLSESCGQFADQVIAVTQELDKIRAAITSITAAWDSAEPLDFADVNLLVHRLRGIVEGGGR
jgi:hypothetical protein